MITKLNLPIILALILFLIIVLHAAVPLAQYYGTVVPISGLMNFIKGPILLIAGIMIIMRAQKRHEHRAVFAHFAFFFIFHGIFLLTIALPHLLVIQGRGDLFPTIQSWAIVEGHFFLYLSMAFFLLASIEFFHPRAAWVAFWAIFIFGIIITWFTIIFPPTPIFDAATGTTLNNFDQRMGWLIPIISTLSFAPAFIIFLVQVFKLTASIARTRALILAIGTILTLISGPLHAISKTPFQFLGANLLVFIGNIFLAIAVLLTSPEEIKETVTN